VANILLVGGLGVEDKQNGHREVSVLLRGIYTYFCGLAQIGRLPVSTRNAWWTGTTSSRYFFGCSSWIGKENVFLSCRLQKCVQIARACDEIWHYVV